MSETPNLIPSSGQVLPPFRQSAAAVMLTRCEDDQGSSGIHWPTLRGALDSAAKLLDEMEEAIEAMEPNDPVRPGLSERRHAVAAMVNRCHWLLTLAESTGAETVGLPPNPSLRTPNGEYFFRHFVVAEILYRSSDPKAYDNLMEVHKDTKRSSRGQFTQAVTAITRQHMWELLAAQGGDPRASLFFNDDPQEDHEQLEDEDGNNDE